MIQTLEVVAGLENTTMLVLSLMVVVVVAAMMILENSTFARERTNHILLRQYHLLMTNQGMLPQLNRLTSGLSNWTDMEVWTSI